METVKENITPVDAGKARKKARNPAAWKRNVEKRNRYIPTSLPEFPTCKHEGKFSNVFKCRELSMRDIKQYHSNYYKHTTKKDQDTFILKSLKLQAPQRRTVLENLKKNRAMSMKYSIICYDKEKKQICQTAFLQILGIKKDRVCNLAKRFLVDGALPAERRGGDRTSHKLLEKKVSVRNFIESLTCIESHYCRSQTKRKYLSCDLSLKKLWRMYNTNLSEPDKIKESFFRTIFNTEYNIGFGSPLTDACSTCLRFKERLKFITEHTEKSTILTEKKLHLLKASAFYGMLKNTDPEVIVFSFDCEKNLPMPKIPDQIAYYSRQFYIYNFTIVQGTSKSRLTKDNVFIYAWSEVDRPKSSNEIASAVFHRLNETEFLPSVKVVRLIADGCGGQNKNSTMLTMLVKWLSTAPATVKTVELIFPVVGHSFMPPDRVFGNIEKVVRSKDHIIEPSEYFDIFQQFGKVINLATECNVNDWREQAKKHIKLPGQWHFQFNPAKRMILTRGDKPGIILIRGELNYIANMNIGKSVLKNPVEYL